MRILVDEGSGPDSGQSTVVVLNRSEELISGCHQRLHQTFGLGVISNRGCDVDVLSESGIRPGRHGEPANYCPSTSTIVEIRSSPSESSLERVHANLAEGRPRPSPSGSYGRDSNQRSMAVSMNDSSVSGYARRNRARCIPKPNSNMSIASRRRSAGESSSMASSLPFSLDPRMWSWLVRRWPSVGVRNRSWCPTT